MYRKVKTFYDSIPTKSIFTVILGLTLTTLNNSYSQENKDSDLSPKQKKQHEAYLNIQNLKKGTLLVCLHSDSARIASLEKNGYTHKAAQIKRENDSLNEIIIMAIKLHYNFSNYLFFDSKDLDAVRNGESFGKLFDAAGNEVNLTTDSLHTFILETRYISMDNMGGQQLGLSIHDYKDDQLENPFPYYVRKRQALSFQRRDHLEMVKLLDQNLKEFDTSYSGN